MKKEVQIEERKEKGKIKNGPKKRTINKKK